ncbi:unnamed protein product [Pylaiella littoralis]
MNGKVTRALFIVKSHCSTSSARRGGLIPGERWHHLHRNKLNPSVTTTDRAPKTMFFSTHSNVSLHPQHQWHRSGGGERAQRVRVRFFLSHILLPTGGGSVGESSKLCFQCKYFIFSLQQQKTTNRIKPLFLPKWLSATNSRHPTRTSNSHPWC